jgi:tetratricopeptide (TPR) repeat protein
MIDEAKEIFIEILNREEYIPAMINLANIYFLNNQYDEARETYERVDQIAPGKPAVLLNLARIHHDEKQYALANKYYTELKLKSPKVGERFAYLETVDDSVARAEDFESLKGFTLWEEED